MNVDLVLVDRQMVTRQRCYQTPQSVETACFGRFRPRTTDRRTRPATMGLHQGQGTTHGGDMDPGAGLSDHRLDQQFACPGGAPPAVVLGSTADNPVQDFEVAVVQLGVAVVFTSIPQPHFAVATKSRGYTVHGRIMHAQDLRGLVGAATIEEVDHDQVAQAYAGVATTSQTLVQPLLDEEADLRDNRHGNSLLGACRPEVVTGREF